MKVLSVVGARPQFVKLAPISSAASAAGVDHVVVHTGQHYDENLSDGIFESLNIPKPEVNLNVGSGSHAIQTAAMLAALEPVMFDCAPDWVLAYGDTNSTLAAAVCATKLHFQLAHLEAGLRSFNRYMPEEHNRVLTDHASDLCLAPSQSALRQLASEGLEGRSVFVGDVMTDVLLTVIRQVQENPVRSPVPLDAEDFVLATLHRPSNTDYPDRLQRLIETLASIPHTVYLAAHPRLISRAQQFGIPLDRGSICIIKPLSYTQLVQALHSATAVVTDSGGLQKEAYICGVPTTTVRAETEWAETLVGGWNQLAVDPSEILASVCRNAPAGRPTMPFGDGRAAAKAIDSLTARDHGQRERIGSQLETN